MSVQKAELALDTTDPAVRAALVHEITAEQQKVDYWRKVIGLYEADIARAQAAVARCTKLLAEGDRGD